MNGDKNSGSKNHTPTGADDLIGKIQIMTEEEFTEFISLAWREFGLQAG